MLGIALLAAVVIFWSVYSELDSSFAIETAAVLIAGVLGGSDQGFRPRKESDPSLCCPRDSRGDTAEPGTRALVRTVSGPHTGQRHGLDSRRWYPAGKARQQAAAAGRVGGQR